MPSEKTCIPASPVRDDPENQRIMIVSAWSVWWWAVTIQDAWRMFITSRNVVYRASRARDSRLPISERSRWSNCSTNAISCSSHHTRIKSPSLVLSGRIPWLIYTAMYVPFGRVTYAAWSNAIESLPPDIASSSGTSWDTWILYCSRTFKNCISILCIPTCILRNIWIHFWIKLIYFIITCNNISVFCSTFDTFMNDHPSFLWMRFESNSSHFPTTITRSISRKFQVDVKWGEAVWTMITSRSLRMTRHFLTTELAIKGIIDHDKHSLFEI